MNREAVSVWSRNIRVFHWVNVIAISLLIIVGVVILNSKLIGVTTDGKILLKTIHVIIGYVFAINLIFRIVVGIIGKTEESWGNTLPFNKGFTRELKDFSSKKHQVYKGHNPAGKLMVLALISAMSVQMITGLVIAGTDIYYPPFGKYFANQIAADKTKTDEIKPYSKTNVNEQAYKEMKQFRKPFITAHVYAFYTLLFLIPLHIIGVIIAEKKERSALVSSMITGYKYLPKKNWL